MSPLAYDPKAVVGGPDATATIAGLAIGLVAGLLQPLYAIVAGGAGLLLAIVFWLLKGRPWFTTVARLGLGLVVGAGLSYVLASLGVLPQGFLGHR